MWIKLPVVFLWSLVSSLNFTVSGIDIVNGYTHAPPPDTPTYLTINDQYANWYFQKHKWSVDWSRVIPVGKAFQGHPEAGALFSKMINGTLKNMDFTTTTHEPCIYRRTFNGKETIILRLVDDIAIAGGTTAENQIIIDFLNETYDLTVRGTLQHATFNGVDIHQAANFVPLSCKTYTDKLKSVHKSWFPFYNQSNRAVPLTSKCASALLKADTCPENTKESRALEKKYSFKYRQAVGELIYALIVVRADLALAVTTVAQLNTQPGEQHFQAVQQLLAYLLSTSDQGLTYWR